MIDVNVKKYNNVSLSEAMMETISLLTETAYNKFWKKELASYLKKLGKKSIKELTKKEREGFSKQVEKTWTRDEYKQFFVAKLEEYNIPYSIADNDLHYLSKSKCCCGEPLVNNSTDFNNTALFFKNKKYNLSDVKESLGDCANCKANHLFTSNRQEGCTTVLDFFNKRFNRKSSPFSKKFMYKINSQTKLLKEK